MEYVWGNEFGWWVNNCIQSLVRVSLGVALALIIGVALGLFRSALPNKIKQNSLLRFVLEAPKFPPPIAWIPFVILFSGIGIISSILIVFIGAFSPIFTATFDGAESLPQIFKDTANSFELNGKKFLKKVLFPWTLPFIITGLRSGLSMGWMSVIAAELVSGQSGLGYSIQLHRLNLQYEFMIIDMVLIGAIGFFLAEFVKWIERLLIPWRNG